MLCCNFLAPNLPHLPRLAGLVRFACLSTCLAVCMSLSIYLSACHCLYACMSLSVYLSVCFRAVCAPQRPVRPQLPQQHEPRPLPARLGRLQHQTTTDQRRPPPAATARRAPPTDPRPGDRPTGQQATTPRTRARRAAPTDPPTKPASTACPPQAAPSRKT